MTNQTNKQICELIRKQIENHGLQEDEQLRVDGPIPISDMEDLDSIITNNPNHSFFKITLEKESPEDSSVYSAVSVFVPYWTLFEGAPFVRNTLSNLRRGFQRKFSTNFSADEIQEAIPRLIQRLNEHPLR